MGSNEQKGAGQMAKKKQALKEVASGNGGSLNIPKSLGNALRLPVLVLPKVPQPTDKEALERCAEKVREGAKVVAAWVESFLTFRDQFADLTREARDIQREQLGITPQEGENALREYLWETETRGFRRAAWKALLRHELSAEKLQRADDLKEALNNLVKDGFLIPDKEGKGPIRVYGIAYSVPDASRFEEEEITEIQEHLAQLVETVNQREWDAGQQLAAELVEQGDLTLQEFLDGAEGTICFVVPAQQDLDREGKPRTYKDEITGEQRNKWRPGGTILAETMMERDGGMMVAPAGEDIIAFPAAGSWRIKKTASTARSLGVSIPLTSLLSDPVPPQKPRAPRRFTREEYTQFYRCFTPLWWFLKRGIEAAKKREAVRPDMDRLDAEATVSREDWFLDEKPGKVLAVHQSAQPWHDEETGKNFPHLFFLVERSEEQTIRIVEVPESLPDVKEYLAPCLDKEFKITGERYEGVDQPFRRMLMAMFGEVAKTTSNSKPEQEDEENGQPVAEEAAVQQP